MEFKLEVVVLPVSDVERAKAFYVDRLGFTLDVDQSVPGGMRVVQSAASNIRLHASAAAVTLPDRRCRLRSWGE